MNKSFLALTVFTLGTAGLVLSSNANAQVRERRGSEKRMTLEESREKEARPHLGPEAKILDFAREKEALEKARSAEQARQSELKNDREKLLESAADKAAREKESVATALDPLLLDTSGLEKEVVEAGLEARDVVVELDRNGINVLGENAGDCLTNPEWTAGGAQSPSMAFFRTIKAAKGAKSAEEAREDVIKSIKDQEIADGETEAERERDARERQRKLEENECKIYRFAGKALRRAG